MALTEGWSFVLSKGEDLITLILWMAVIFLALLSIAVKCQLRGVEEEPPCLDDYVDGQEAAERDCPNCSFRWTCRGKGE